MVGACVLFVSRATDKSTIKTYIYYECWPTCPRSDNPCLARTAREERRNAAQLILLRSDGTIGTPSIWLFYRYGIRGCTTATVAYFYG